MHLERTQFIQFWHMYTYDTIKIKIIHHLIKFSHDLFFGDLWLWSWPPPHDPFACNSLVLRLQPRTVPGFSNALNASPTLSLHVHLQAITDPLLAGLYVCSNGLHSWNHRVCIHFVGIHVSKTWNLMSSILLNVSSPVLFVTGYILFILVYFVYPCTCGQK
jgi:hypothetical protein